MIPVIPKKSIGNIKLGDEIEEVRSMFGNKYSNTVKDGSCIDHYDNVGFEVDYLNGQAAFIGVNSPKEAEFNGVNLSLARYSQIKEIFNNSQEKYGDDNSLTFMDLGITFYFEDDDEDPQPLQVAIFVDGYYANVMHTFEAID